MNRIGRGAPSRPVGAGCSIGATVAPARAAGAGITWSVQSDLVTLDKTTGANVQVTARNTTNRPQWIPITATTSNGFRVTAWVYAEPRYINPPTLTKTPAIGAPQNGVVRVAYDFDLGPHEDQSLVSWFLCDDSQCSKSRAVAVSRGNQPLKALPLMPGFSGKFIKVSLQPKIEISEAGPAVSAISAMPIAAG